MVIVKNKTLLFSNREQYLGTSYDNNSAIRCFEIQRHTIDGVDIAGLTFRMNVNCPDGSAIDEYLEKEVRDDVILLTWKITDKVLKLGGTMFINIRAFNSTGSVKWASYLAPVYSEGTGRLPEVSKDQITDFERMEALINEIYEADTDRRASEEERKAAEAARVEAELSREEKVKVFDDAIAEAELHADRADEEANRAEQEADRASMYADFITPEFLLQDNRIYLKTDKKIDFTVNDNRLYIKLA